jgi:UDP-glucuronate 4-epimerase
VDDSIHGIENLLYRPPEVMPPAKVYYIGNNKPEKLLDFVATLEKAIGKKAVVEYLPMQPGDVYQTYANVDELINDFGFKPSTSIEVGLGRFVEWTLEYYKGSKAVEQ